MFDRISFVIFVRYSFAPETDHVFGAYDSEVRAQESLQHCFNYAEACKKDGTEAPVYRLARARIMESDEEPAAYEPPDSSVCVCGHAKSEHSGSHPSGQSPCIVEGEAVFGAYADDCMKFRPAYNAHAALN